MSRQDQIHDSSEKNEKRANSFIGDELAPDRCEFEERLDVLGRQIDEMRASEPDSWHPELPGDCNLADELRVKAEAARWMLRVSKHLTGGTRERVLSAVRKSLGDLERIMASQVEPVTSRILPRETHAAATRR